MIFRIFLTKFAAKYICFLKMKRKFFPLTFLLAGVFMLASCLGDDTNESNMTYYGDAAVTSFSLGTLKKYYLYNNGDTIKTTVDGTDSTTTVDCSGYKMAIDQLGFAKDDDGNIMHGVHPIENVDSLPAGTDISKVVCTLNTKNSGVAALLRLKKNAVDKDTLDYYTGDSVDLRKPREFRIYSSDGTALRRYQVRLNVHKEQPDSFVWHKQSLANIVDEGHFTGARLLPANDKMYLAMSDGNGTVIAAKDINDDGARWRILTSNMNMVFDADAYKNIAVLDGWLYLYNGYGELFRARDGQTWEVVRTDGDFVNVKCLAGAGGGKLYAVTSAGVISSSDGSAWALYGTENNEMLPKSNVNVCTLPLKTNTDVERVLMIGDAQQGDTAAVVWGKIDDKSETADSYSWSMYESVSKRMLPNMKGLSVMVYDGALFAIGGEGQNNSAAAPYATLYRSTDQGLTWHSSKLFTLPKDFRKDKNADAICMAADKENHVWLVSLQTAEVWKMRINRLGWAK